MNLKVVLCLALVWSGGMFSQPLVPHMGPDGLWGYRDSLSEEWRIAPGYHHVSTFRDGKALVTTDELSYLGPGGGVFPPLYRVRSARRWRPQHIVDSLGKVLFSLPTGFMADPWVDLRESKVAVRDPLGNYGAICLDGELDLPFRYQKVWSFGENLRAVQVDPTHFDSLYFSLNKVLQDQVDQRLRKWRQSTLGKKWRNEYPYAGLNVVFMDSANQVVGVLPPPFIPPTEGPFRFQQGLIVAWDLSKEAFGLLDQDFQIALPFEYQQLSMVVGNVLFAERRRNNLQDESGYFAGIMDISGVPLFNIPLDLFRNSCQYRVEGKTYAYENGMIHLLPAYCDKSIVLKISQEGDMLGYYEVLVR